MRRLIFLFMLLLMCMPALADYMPNTISYVGYLRDSNNARLSGTYNMDFAIYDDYSSGNNLWDEASQVITVTNGLFTHNLGQENPINLTGDSDYYLEVTISGESLSRVNFTQSMYSYRAQIANNLTSTNNYTVDYITADLVNSTGRIYASGNITAPSTIITDSMGMIFPVLQDMWAFVYGSGTIAPDTGIRFDAGMAAIENKYLNKTFFYSDIYGKAYIKDTLGELFPGLASDIILDFLGADGDGQLKWMEDEMEFRFNSTVNATALGVSGPVTIVGNITSSVIKSSSGSVYVGDLIRVHQSPFNRVCIDGGGDADFSTCSSTLEVEGNNPFVTVSRESHAQNVGFAFGENGEIDFWDILVPINRNDLLFNNINTARTSFWINVTNDNIQMARNITIGWDQLNGGDLKIQFGETTPGKLTSAGNITWLEDEAEFVISSSTTINQIMRVTANTSAIVCNATMGGRIYYDGVLNKHFGCNTSVWQALY